MEHEIFWKPLPISLNLLTQGNRFNAIQFGQVAVEHHLLPAQSKDCLFDAFCGVVRGADAKVEAGRFGANMRVELEGDGPVTIVVSTDGWAEADIRKPT